MHDTGFVTVVVVDTTDHSSSLSRVMHRVTRTRAVQRRRSRIPCIVWCCSASILIAFVYSMIQYLLYELGRDIAE